MHLSEGTTLQGGRYLIEKVLGQGDFGITYLGEDVSMARKVAIKEFFVKDFCNRDKETNNVVVATENKIELVNRLRREFIEEARALFRMSHPNIVCVTNIFEENGTAYYVMDYIDGWSLAPHAKMFRRLSENSSPTIVPTIVPIIVPTFKGYEGVEKRCTVPSFFASFLNSFFKAFARKKFYSVYSSVFATAKARVGFPMSVQVYLHKYEDCGRIEKLAEESECNSKRRDCVPLSLKLRRGDCVDVELIINGETCLFTERKSVIWQGDFAKCTFMYIVPDGLRWLNWLDCKIVLSVNGVPVGEMRFVTRIAGEPAYDKILQSEINVRKYNKIFISYAHKDESKVKYLAEGFRAMNADYFFDRHYLKAGDLYPLKIQEYIDSADLFILCWSENAMKSEYVNKERLQALKRAFPNVKPAGAAKLTIFPISIEPRTSIPDDMKEYYHFGEI